MGAAARTQRLEYEKQSLETAFLDALKLALRDCADGRWGLFKQNEGLLAAALESRLTPPSVVRLHELEAELVAVREQLGYPEPYHPMQRLAELRSRGESNALGEQKLAEMFLQELAAME